MLKNMRAKILSAVLCAGLLAGMMPTTALADVAEVKIRAIKFEDGGSSTIYVNEAKCSGGSTESIKYFYSSDSIGKAAKELDGAFSGYPDLRGLADDATGVALSTSGTPTSQWSDATWVANNVITDIGTVTESANTVDVSAISMDTDETSIKNYLEAENYAAWQTQEAANQAQWEATHGEGDVYVPSVYVSLDFTETTIDTPPSRNTNQFLAAVGIFYTGPFRYAASNVNYYDLYIVCHKVTVLSETATKAVAFAGVTLPVKTIESAADTDYVLRPGLSAKFTPDVDTTFGELQDNHSVNVDYYNPMQSAPAFDSGYTKAVEYNITVPTSSSVDGKITVPLPSGYDGASAKIMGGASSSSSTSSTVTFPVTLASGMASFIVEYKEATTPAPSSNDSNQETGNSDNNDQSSKSTTTEEEKNPLVWKYKGSQVGSLCTVEHQGPLCVMGFKNGTPAGYQEAFSFNLREWDKSLWKYGATHSLKKGEFVMEIPKEWQKKGRTFMLIGIDKNGKTKVFKDMDTSDETFTTTLDMEGYAFSLIYSDEPATKK